MVASNGISVVRSLALALMVAILLSGCASPKATPEALIENPTAVAPAVTAMSGAGEVDRSILTFDELVNGFDFDSPLDESALTMPEGAATAVPNFEGRLELIGEKAGGRMEVLRGDLDTEYAFLPEFDYEFVQSGSYLIPTRRGLIIADTPGGI